MQYLGLASLLLGLTTTARWFQLAVRVDIPHNPSWFRLLWGAGFVLAVGALLLDSTDGFALWGVGVGVVMLYLSFTGAQRVDGQMIEVGDVLPTFTALDESGKTFDSTSLSGSRVLLKFFRGHW